MIIGVGTDITRQERFSSWIYDIKFLRRILTANELKNFYEKRESRRANFLAKRFAAKEAFSKALGVGIGGNFEGIPITFSSMEIINNSLGQPFCNVLDSSLKEKLGNIHISISDEGSLVLAFIVITKPYS
jgi:holo-[acyl-carrier protein] synthase